MNLKDFFVSRETPPEIFWSVVLEEGSTQAGIWYIKTPEGGGSGVAEVIDVSPVTSWESEEELVGAVDAALSSCVQKLPDEFTEPTKTVFGVPSSWVKEGEIKEEYLGKIKRVCTELSLTPTGFVVLPEAISHLFKMEEGAPLNAVVLGLGRKSLEISVFKMGNLAGTTEVARSVSLVDDVVEGLSRFEGASPLPSRIVIFDGKEGELTDAKDQLSAATWDQNQKLKFLHTPKVETLDLSKKIMATSLAGASEIGNVSKVETEEKAIAPVQVKEATPDASPEDLGFAINEDVTIPAMGAKVAAPEIKTPFPTHQELGSPIASHTPKSFNFGGILQKINGFFSGIIAKLSFKKSFVPLIVILGILLIGAFAFWWFYPKATVSIYVSPKVFEEEFDITFNEGGDSSLEDGVVPGKIAETAVSGEKTTNTTGTKLIGDKAKGTVQIQNGTGTAINLPAGTILLSSGDLRFSLDSSASVSAALSPSSPGTTTASVTSEAIGAEFNLAKNETFKVGNYPKSEVDATATSDFSGGSSREISAVALADQEKLVEELTNELLERARNEFSDKASAEEVFVSELVAFDVTDKSFSHKVGDEAGSLKLNLSVEAKGILADKVKLAELVREKLKDKIPQGFVLRDSQIEYVFEFIESQGENHSFKATVSVNFLPEIKQEEIVKQIKGRRPDIVENYLSSIPGFARAQIRIRPLLPGPFGTLPRVGKNITIEVVAE